MTGLLYLSSVARATTSLDDIDTEVARLALLCDVRILEPGVVERVVRNDASVCGKSNSIAFGKLKGMLALHFRVRELMGDAHGQVKASCIEQHVIDRLRARFPTLAGEWSPASR